MLASGKMLLAILRDLEQGRYMDHIKHRIITSLPSIQKMRDHLPSKSTRIGNFSDPLISSTNALSTYLYCLSLGNPAQATDWADWSHPPWAHQHSCPRVSKSVAWWTAHAKACKWRISNTRYEYVITVCICLTRSNLRSKANRNSDNLSLEIPTVINYYTCRQL